jgi:hypothetical protein
MNTHISLDGRDRYYELLEHVGRFVMLRERLTPEEFFSLHETDVTDFLRKFNSLYEADVATKWKIFTGYDSVPVYRKIGREFYQEVWKERLAPKIRTNAVDQLLDLKRSFADFFELMRDVPALKTILGGDQVVRLKSRAKETDARISQIWKQAGKTIRLLERAAYQLSLLRHPNALDLSNMTRLNARVEEMKGFRELRKDLPDFRVARDAFRRAVCHAHRRQRVLRNERSLAHALPAARRHVWKLRYWQNVAAVAALLLDGRFAEAGRRVPVMATYFSRLPDLAKWFVGPEDVNNYSLVIRSYESLITRRDLSGAQALLGEWLERSKDLSDTGRYMRLKARKMTVDVLLAWAESKPAARRAVLDLMRLLESRRSFGSGEMYIRSVMQALVEGHIEYETALTRLSGVFVLEAAPPSDWGGYFDHRTEEERRFRFLPAFFYEWLVEPGGNEPAPDECLYVLLLYARCVAEFWCGVHSKRLVSGEVKTRLSRKVPGNFSQTDWDELLALLADLASVFDTEPSLRQLSETLQGSRATLSGAATESPDGQPSTTEELRAFIVDVICKTERYAFPEPVYLERKSAPDKGVMQVVLRRTRRAPPRQFNFYFVPRRGQVLREGGCYFLKPSFKRSEKVTGLEELVLHPLRPVSCYGEPGDDRVALLVEGAHDITVFESVLSRLNPHWRARVQIVEAGGVERIPLRSRDLAELFKHVIVVGDAVRAGRQLVDTRRMNPELVFELNPDLEGVHAEALRLTLAEFAPDLPLTKGEVEKVIADARAKKKATVDCLRDYQRRRDGSTHDLFYDLNRLKKRLAEPLGRKMVEVGPPEQVIVLVEAALRLGFGHP